MTAFSYVCAALGAWLVVGALVATRVGRMLRRADTYPLYPPPLPAISDSDLDWLFNQPDEVWLTDPVVRDRCRQIEIAEGWAR